MNNKLRGMVYLVLLVMVLQFSAGHTAAVPVNPWADAQDTLLADDDRLASPALHRAISVMEGLELYDFTTVQLENSMTRGEFAHAIWTALGLGASNEKTGFYQDVPASAKFFTPIQVLRELGMMSGYTDGSFYPEQPITQTEALASLVKAMGFNTQAQASGGYPAGYLMTAANRGLLRGASIQDERHITWSDGAILLYNALTADAPKLSGANAHYATHTVERGYSLLSKYRNLYADEGIVSSNAFTELKTQNKPIQGTILIGEQVCKTDQLSSDQKSRVDSYLGKNTLYFYREGDEEERELQLLYTNNLYNDIASFTQQSTLEWKGDNRLSVIHKDGTREQHSLSETADVIRNGRNIGAKAHTLTENDFHFPTGNITLIDNNRDGAHDVVIINDYQTYLVHSVSSATSTIFDKYGSPALTLDERDLANYNLITLLNGSRVSLSSIKEWDVLAVTVSDDLSLTRIIVLRNNVISGQVTEVVSSDGELVIDGAAYATSQSYRSDTNAEFSPTHITIGTTGTFLLDIDGCIVAVRSTEEQGALYGYLVDAAKKSAIAVTAEYKIFTQRGTMQTYEGANKMTLNGTSGRTNDQVIVALKQGFATVQSQLIQYSLNDEGKLVQIKMAYDQWGGKSNGVSFYPDALELSAYEAIRQWKPVSSFFGFDVPDNTFDPATTVLKDAYKEFFVNPQTIIFSIPTLAERKSDDKGYSIQSVTDLSQDANYIVEAYDTNNSYEARVVVMQKSAGLISDNDTKIGVISHRTKALTPDGDEMDMLYVYYNNSLTGYALAKDCLGYLWNYATVSDTSNHAALSTFKTGDIVRLGLNSDGHISIIAKMMPQNATSAHSKTAAHFYKDRNLYSEKAYGQVYEKVGSLMMLGVTEGSIMTKLPYRISGSAHFYRYNVGKNTVELASANDILDVKNNGKGSYVYIRSRNTVLQEVVIIDFNE